MLTEIQIQDNWNELMTLLKTDSRSEKLIAMYEAYGEDLAIAPASGNANYHNCFPGGYVDHVLRVTKCAENVYNLWKSLGAEVSSFTLEELRFAAINHDLGKAGDINLPYYVPNSSEWHRKNQGLIYELNKELSYMKVPDRSLYTLQKWGISITENEYLAIKLHDGLYSESNKPYYMTIKPEMSIRSNIVYIIHQADLLASRIEHANNISHISTQPTAKLSTPKTSGGTLSSSGDSVNFDISEFFK